MTATETLEDFYNIKLNQTPRNLQQDLGHFNVFRMEDCVGAGKTPIQYSRRDFYKITLLRGRHRYHYADKTIEVSGTALVFFNPSVPYMFEPLSEDIGGSFCIFREAFFT